MPASLAPAHPSARGRSLAPYARTRAAPPGGVGRVNFVSRDGSRHQVNGKVGDNLMYLAHRYQDDNPAVALEGASAEVRAWAEARGWRGVGRPREPDRACGISWAAAAPRQYVANKSNLIRFGWFRFA